MHDIEHSYPMLAAYCEWVRQQCPTAIDSFCVASALTAMAACVAPTRMTPFGDGLVHFLVLVAGSGVGKKIPTLCAAKVVKNISPMLLVNREPNSINGLLTRLRQQPGILYPMQEFGSWFENICQSQATAQRQIATSFLKLWDSPEFLEGLDTKNEADAMDCVDFPVVTILGNMTNEAWLRVSRLKGFKHDGLGGRFEPIIVSDEEERCLVQGELKLVKEGQTIAPAPVDVLEVFAKVSRFTLEDISKAERYPTPDDPNQKKFSNIVYRPRIPFGIEADARKLIEYYRAITTSQKWKFDGIAAHIIARKMSRVIRTACLLACFDCREMVSSQDVELANLFHTQNFEKALESYSIGNKDDIVGVIEETMMLELRTGAKKWSTLTKIKSIKNNSLETFLKAKQSMLKSGKVTSNSVTTKGRPAEWLALVNDEEEVTPKIKFTINPMPDDEAFLR